MSDLTRNSDQLLRKQVRERWISKAAECHAELRNVLAQYDTEVRAFYEKIRTVTDLKTFLASLDEFHRELICTSAMIAIGDYVSDTLVEANESEARDAAVERNTISPGGG